MEAYSPTPVHMLVPRASQSGAQQGSHRGQGSSLSALLSTLIPVFIVAAIIFVVFIFFQKKFDRVYGPRTYLPVLDHDERSPKQSAGFMGWTKEFRDLTDEYVLGHSSLDNYLFLRMFKILMVICFVGCLITWPVLFPVNATGGGGQSGLDILSFSNIEGAGRYYATAIMSWIFLAFVMYMISRESLFYAYLRQAYLLSPYVTSQISSKTVLFTDVPEHYRDEGHLRHIFEHVRYIWLAHDPEDLEDMVDERDQAAGKLETGEIKMIQGYVKKREKAIKKGQESDSDARNGDNVPQIDQKDRPTHKLKPIIGKKVDTIDWSRGELHRLVPEVARKQAEQRSGKSKKIGAVFIEFETVRAAQAAFQQVAHQTPFNLTPKDIGMKPEMIIWKNLKKPWWQVKILAALGTAFITFCCIFWTIPVAFVGILTNVNYLTNKVPFLSFIDDIPSQILGVVTGLLPVILLAVLMALVPIICTLIASQFEPTQGAVQLKTQGWYFWFQVIQVFLITTFSSGATAVATQIVQMPSTAPTLLAKNLPKASNFYISYFVLNGLMTAALQFLNVVPLLFVLVLGKLLDKTPKKMYNRYVNLAGIGWGSYYPKFTNLGVIALSYSCIAPLMLGFATVGFGLIYLGFRYNIFFTLGTNIDVKGRCYQKALQQLTVGIYLSEICLIGLFAIGSSGSLLSIGPLIMMIVFLIGTILWHLQLRSALHKHITNLPQDLLAEEYEDRRFENDEAEKGRNGRNEYDTNGVRKNDSNGSSGSDTLNTNGTAGAGPFTVPRSADPPEPPKGIMGKIKSFIFVNKYSSAAVLSKHILFPHLSGPVGPYTRQGREEAYMHPAVVGETPIIWLARDRFGISRQEVLDSRRTIGEGVEITDEDAWFDHKGKVTWDERRLKEAPLWEEKPDY